MVKPFRRILAKEEGKPSGKVVFVFYQEGYNEYFVLGSFVKTLDQILFFPGMRFSQIIYTIDGRDLEHNELHNIDQFSLEKHSLTNWHITTLQKKTKSIR